jgi:predicted nucleotidyltransferase
MMDTGRRAYKEQVLKILREESPYLQEQYGVVRLALYGSFAQDTSTKSSDVDLLVELSRPLGLEFVALAERLETLLGRKVNLATYETLHRNLASPRYHLMALNIQQTLIDVWTKTEQRYENNP